MSDDIAVFNKPSLAEQLRRSARLWRTVADRELAPLGLTNSRWTLLWKLKGLNNNVSQKTLAKALEIELPSLMRTLTQLETQGLIKRHCCNEDKRARIVTLTDAGKSILIEIEDLILMIRSDLLAGIDDAELRIFQKVVERITFNAINKLDDHNR
ncbi:MAG: MarR family transcriptional regulator for hemolysin [Psychromonas sp.]|jgi:MarR family transcriptional regulator for hemolysin|uniref:transcriptional regulator SlyA n=1 Tax=Psychromonas sp. TaxID=1884585 RepID=UPI0039E61C91